MYANLRRLFPVTLLVLAVVGLLAAAPVAEADTGLLDGRTFEVQMGKKGSSEGQPNTLTFLSGTFLSAHCVNFDFPQSEYRATRGSNSIDFEVRARSYTEGYMDWKGTVRGDRIEATAVWHRPGHDEPIELWIRGKAK